MEPETARRLKYLVGLIVVAALIVTLIIVLTLATPATPATPAASSGSSNTATSSNTPAVPVPAAAVATSSNPVAVAVPAAVVAAAAAAAPVYTYTAQSGVVWDNGPATPCPGATNRDVTGNNGDYNNYCIFDSATDAQNWCNSQASCKGYVGNSANKFQITNSVAPNPNGGTYYAKMSS